MYTKEQALKEYVRLGSVYEVICRLGHPNKTTLYHWYERKKAGLEDKHGYIEGNPVSIKTEHCCNTPEHPKHTSAELKFAPLR